MSVNFVDVYFVDVVKVNHKIWLSINDALYNNNREVYMYKDENISFIMCEQKDCKKSHIMEEFIIV